MDQLLHWPWNFMIIIVVLGILVIILTSLVNKSEHPSGGYNHQEEEPEPLTKVSLFLPDGKLFEEHIVESNSIDLENNDGTYLQFETKEGKQLTFLSRGFLVKMEDL